MEFSEASLRDMSETQQQMDGPESAQFTTPNFDIDAVRTLTEKIQGGLKTQSTGSVLGKSSAKLKSSNGSTKSKSGGKKSRAPLSNPSSNGKTTAVKKAEHTVTSKQTQGKKRSRDGNFKDDTYSNNNADVNSIKLGRRAPKSTANENSKIEDEIRALGGTEEDLDLIQNALSESEMEGEDPQESKPLGSSLNKETLQLVRQLGVDNMGRAYMLAESESEMERVVSQLDVSELDGKTMRSLNGIKPATIASRPIGKSQRVLVSLQQLSLHWKSETDGVV